MESSAKKYLLAVTLYRLIVKNGLIVICGTVALAFVEKLRTELRCHLRGPRESGERE
jgi:hypothetical protein